MPPDNPTSPGRLLGLVCMSPTFPPSRIQAISMDGWASCGSLLTPLAKFNINSTIREAKSTSLDSFLRLTEWPSRHLLSRVPPSPTVQNSFPTPKEKGTTTP